MERNPPALVIEVEMTRADEGKIARYADLGVRELWRLHGGEEPLRADFLALRRGEAPRSLPASEVLPGLTPEEVGQSIQPARPGRGADGRSAGEPLVRRREQPAAYATERAEVEPVPAPSRN